MIQSKITGLNRIAVALLSWNSGFKNRVSAVLYEYGAKMQSHARGDHAFQNRSGNLNRAITYKVDKDKLVLSFYIDDSLVMSGKWNYGWIQHDGSGMGYKNSKSFIKVSPTLQSGGIQHDHFLDRAWDKFYPDMERDVKKAIFKVL